MNDGLTKEDREYLIGELKKFLGEKPFFYMKFCSKESFANDVLDGNLYANTVEYFRKIEIDKGERGQGDALELVLPFQADRISMYDCETSAHVMDITCSNIKLKLTGDEEVPIVSFVGIPIDDMVLVDADEGEARFRFPFTDEEYATMEERFGKYCVLIGARELEARIDAYCKSINCEYIFDKIEYCGQNRLERMQAFAKCAKERFLYKNADLSYQRECRLALPIKMPEDHFIRIGKLESAKTLLAKDLKNLAISVQYTSYRKLEE